MSPRPIDATHRRIKLFRFCPWADQLEDAAAFTQRLPAIDLAQRVANPKDEKLLRMARLDCDWHGAITQALAATRHASLNFLPSQVVGIQGLLDFARASPPANEEWWLVFEGHSPQKIAVALGKLLPFLTRNGVRILYYSFDEASRAMPCFRELAPFLSILIHDESPLDERSAAALPPACTRLYRSPMANLVPFATSFNDNPEPKIVFLGSKLGLNEHRLRQINHLQEKFGSRFIAIHDHSLDVRALTTLNRYKVSVCPEGRLFTTTAMSATHTDRPFWSGCLGMVPVSEDSRTGGRLEALATQGLIIRYAHGDLNALTAACEQALALHDEHRKRIYNHFNQHETIGTVIADAIAATR